MSGMIVRTPGTLGGNPRLDGHRIGVHHVMSHFRIYGSLELVQSEVWDYLTIEQLQAAMDYYTEHTEEIDAILRENQRGWEEKPQ